MNLGLDIGVSGRGNGNNVPTMVTNGLVMWLDGTDTSTMTLVGSRVDEWRCKYGTGNKLATSSGGTTKNPTYSAANVGGIGGLAFNGSRWLESGSTTFAPLNYSNGITTIAIVKKTGRNGFFMAAADGQAGLLGFSFAERVGFGSYWNLSRYGVPRNAPVVMGCRLIGNSMATTTFLLENQILSSDDSTSLTLSGTIARLGVGAMPNASAGYVGEIAAIFFYNRKLTDIEFVQQANWMITQYNVPAAPSPTWNVVVEGNSIALGFFGTNVCAAYDGSIAANGMPSSPTSRDVLMVASSGMTTANMITRYTTRVLPHYNTSISAIKRILIVWEIGNDIGNNATRTDTQAYNNIKSYCQQAVADGWKVVVVTATPRTPSPSTFNSNSNFETYRLSVNSQIVANAVAEGWAHAVANVGGDATIGATGAYSNTTYFNDGCHFKDAGHTIAKTYITNAINAITGL